MRMHFLAGGRLRMRKTTYLPDAGSDEMIELPVSCVLLRHAQGNVLFDTGCHPSVAENPEPRWGPLTKFMVPVMTKDANVIAELSSVGVAPDDIDVVVCSHLHTDHCGCNAFFRKATIIVHALELEAAKAPDAVKIGYVRVDWDHPMPMTTISSQTDVMGDGRIVLVPLPGHTPGTIGALIELDRSGRFLLASDALSIRENLDRQIVPRNTWNAELCARSFSEIKNLEGSGIVIICGHDAAQWEQLRKGQDAYD